MSSTRGRLLQPIASSLRWLVVGLALVLALTATLRAETRTSSAPPVEGGGVFDPKLAAVSGANYVFLDPQRTVNGAPRRITGEATLRGFEGLTRAISVHGLGAIAIPSGTTGTRVQLGELTLTHYYDLISPDLFRMAARGELLNPSTNLQFVKVSGGTQQVLLRVFFGKLQVIDVKEAQPQGSSNLVETVRFTYSEVLYEYYTYEAEGGDPTRVVKACWDLLRGTASWQGKPCV